MKFRCAISALLIGLACGCASVDSRDSKERAVALARINNPVKLAQLVRESPYGDVRQGAVERIADLQVLKEIVLDGKIEKKLRENAVVQLLSRKERSAVCLEIFQQSDEPWLMYAVVADIGMEEKRLPEVMGKIHALWKDPSFSLDQRAWIYVISEGGDYSMPEDQSVLAEALTFSRHWKLVLDKVVATGDLVDADALLGLALGAHRGDKSVALWAVEKLDDAGLMTVVKRGNLQEVGGKAIKLLKSDEALLELTLDKSLPIDYRQEALSQLLGRLTAEESCRKIYLGCDEFWLADKALAKLGDVVLAEKPAIAKSLSWMKDEGVALDDRVRVYFAIPGDADFSDPVIQKVLCEMIVGAKDGGRVFERVAKHGSLTSKHEILMLADGEYDVDEAVSMWAVDLLEDDDLLAVAGKTANSKVVFKAVRTLKGQDAIAKVAKGDFGMVARLEAIKRLGRESASVLQEIVTSTDANLRNVALQRMTDLGCSTKAAEEFIRKDDEAREAEKAQLQELRNETIKAAQRDIELAKIDEAIKGYRSLLGGSPPVETQLTFKGTIVSIVSKNWKPKIRVLVKGAHETLHVLCLVPGKFTLPVEEGSKVIVSGQFKAGNSSEATLSDASISLDKGAE